MENESPKLFISYSWTTQEHEQWVLTLATELRDSGVDVIFDKWDLREGHDANAFMEQMVTDDRIEKVILVCDQAYASKADGRSGGVGTEAQIISAEVYAKKDQSKFVAVLSEKDSEDNPCLPAYYKSRIYVDLSDDNLYSKNLDQLLRWVFDKPLYEKPPIGKKPDFLDKATGPSLGTVVAFRRSLDAIRNNKGHCSGAIIEYFTLFAENLERFRIQANERELDDLVVESIDTFTLYRNEAIDLFLTLAQYRGTTETALLLHSFFESLIPYMDVPEGVRSYSDWDFDNFKFIIHELFLYCIAALLKYEQFEVASYLLSHDYFVERNASRNSEPMVSFCVFLQYIKSLDHRNERLQLGRLSVRADMLNNRPKARSLQFLDLMQADFILLMRDTISAFRREVSQCWQPETFVALGYQPAFSIFSRSQSLEYFERMSCLLDIRKKAELEPVLAAFNEGKLVFPRLHRRGLSPGRLLNYEAMATKA